MKSVNGKVADGRERPSYLALSESATTRAPGAVRIAVIASTTRYSAELAEMIEEIRSESGKRAHPRLPFSCADYLKAGKKHIRSEIIIKIAKIRPTNRSVGGWG